MQIRSISDIVLTEGLVTADDLAAARSVSKDSNALMVDIFVRLGSVDDEALTRALSSAWAIPVLDPNNLPPDTDAYSAATSLMGLTHSWMQSRHAAMWLDYPDDNASNDTNALIATHLCVAVRNPFDPILLEAVDNRLRELAAENSSLAASHITPQVNWFLSPRALLDTIFSIQNQNDISLNGDEGMEGSVARLKEMAEEAPVIDFVRNVFASAIKQRASDIHLEPSEHHFEVRYRIDGVIQSSQKQARARFNAISTRIKLLSGMDIAETRLPQDGRQSIRIGGEDFDLRVSSIPGAWGESIVIRLLNKRQNIPALSELGLVGQPRQAVSNLLASPDGIILVTGPTGSGKSTTLYKGLEEINDGHRKIITVEDPIEYDMSRVTQVQVNTDIGLTFARGLRSILRQDPDVIMVGEIRDEETASIAAQSALTGHLVLSTLHTNSALLAVPRLLDLGLEPFLIASAVKGLIAQRLVRKLCPDCAEPGLSKDVHALLAACHPDVASQLQATANWQQPKGCPNCLGTGYRGRLALYEAVVIDTVLRDAILGGARQSELEALARQQGFQPLIEDGASKAALGLTSATEILKVAAESSHVTEPA